MRKGLIALLLVSGVAFGATPLMQLTLPTVGVTTGPQWATLINAAFTLIDSHNHTTGNGAKVPVAGLNINADLGLAGYNLNLANSTRFVNQSTALVGVNDIRSVYVANGDLYYNNSSGTAVQLTSGSGINVAALGTIGGDYGGSNPAAVNFSEATSTYSFLESSGIVGRMAVGPTTFFHEASGASGVTVRAPTSAFSSYTLTLPTAQSSVNNIMKSDASGNLSFGQLATAEIATSAVTTDKIADSNVTTAKIADSNITTAKIADSNVTTAKIADGAITQAKRVALNYQISSSSGAVTVLNGSPYTTVTNLSVTLTTTGRPVFVGLVHDGSSNVGLFGGTSLIQNHRFRRNGTSLGEFQTQSASVPFGALTTVDFPSAGSTTYDIQIAGAGTNATCWYAKLVAYEL